MRPIHHAIAGGLAMSIIAIFWISTIFSELFMDATTVAMVKHAIVMGLFLLVPCMAATGGTGAALSGMRKGTLLDRKKKRITIIGANGLLVMIPAAIFLDDKAAAGEFDVAFYLVQGAELIIGIIQISLMAMNFRDGLRLAGKLKPSAA